MTVCMQLEDRSGNHPIAQRAENMHANMWVLTAVRG